MTEFQSVPLAVKVYKFAHKMQINQLMEKLDEYFKAASPSDVFSIYDFYKIVGNEAGLDTCRKVCPYYTLTHSVNFTILTTSLVNNF